MTDSCLGDLDWNCSGPITMEKKKKKIQIHFPPTWKQSHYLLGVMTQPAGADMSRRCLMETKCTNGSQNRGKKSLLTLIESRFSYVNSRRMREEAVRPVLSNAENCLSAFSYLSSQEKLYARCFVPAVKPVRVCWTASLTPLNQLIQDRNFNFALFSLVP